MAESRSKNHRKPPGFLPGVLCRGCGGCGLALPGVSVPPAACPLWAALCAAVGRFSGGQYRDSTPARGGSVGRLWAFPAVLFPGAVDCLRLCAAVGGSVTCFGACLCPCTLARLRGSVRPLWRLWAWVYGTACTRGGCVHHSRRGLWRDREKPGQAVQAPPGRKRTAAGIAPGAALWFHLFIFSNSDRIANGIIKSTKRTNIFDFHPLKQR